MAQESDVEEGSQSSQKDCSLLRSYVGAAGRGKPERRRNHSRFRHWENDRKMDDVVQVVEEEDAEEVMEST